MGTLALQQFQPFLASSALDSGVPFEAPPPLTPRDHHAKPVGDEPPGRRLGFEHNREDQVDRAFEATVYREQIERVSLSARLREVSARITDLAEENTEAPPVTAQQLEFEFFAETRVSERLHFEERMTAVGDGLQGTRQSTLIEASREVSARFEMSMTISGAALNGFANAAEGLSNYGDLFDQLMTMAFDLLQGSEEHFNEALSFFDGSILADAGNSFAETFAQIRETLLGAMGSLGQGTPPPAEGQQTSGAASIQLEFHFEFSASVTVTVQEGQVQQSDPILFDLDGDGYELSHHTQGANFDILGNGQSARTAFVTGGDAFLALDRNGDGIVNSGRELFGDQNGAANGFEELRKLDTNGDNVIDRRDADFGRLLLFRDDGDGRTEDGELLTLAEAGIESISLNYSNVDLRTAGANRLGQIASFRRTDGTTGGAADAILNFTA